MLLRALIALARMTATRPLVSVRVRLSTHSWLHGHMSLGKGQADEGRQRVVIESNKQRHQGYEQQKHDGRHGCSHLAASQVPLRVVWV